MNKKTEESFEEYDHKSFPDVIMYLRQKVSGSPEELRRVKEILDQTAAGLAAVFCSLYTYRLFPFSIHKNYAGLKRFLTPMIHGLLRALRSPDPAKNRGFDLSRC